MFVIWVPMGNQLIPLAKIRKTDKGFSVVYYQISGCNDFDKSKPNC
jgi:hypothetical protein